MELSHARVIALPAEFDATSLRALEVAFGEPDGRVLVLSGHAPGTTFCRGLSLEQAAASADPDAARRSLQRFADLLVLLTELPVPRVAAVDGAAIGGGVGFAAACDVVLATPRATFALPELLWGFFPASIWPVLSDRVAGRALEALALQGHSIDAAEALRIGLIDRIVPVHALEQAVRQLVRSVARGDATCLAPLRTWRRRQASRPLREAILEGGSITAALVARPSTQRRLQRYLDGEAPWT
ncbi:MAG: enoyl-CoA hydratase/isomerase family protein [Gemmatimonadaceae bacterium]|nr:enoyl-CoA hydratase/isomerase family protein [Gemmatimonadaceae bacterium]